MPAHSGQIAAAVDHFADLLEIEGANPFRIRACRGAARTIEDLPRSAVETRIRQNFPASAPTWQAGSSNLPITRQLAVLDAAKARLPPGIVELSNVPGLPPKMAGALYNKLKVHSVVDLKMATTAGKLHGLAGFDVKSETKLVAELKRRAKCRGASGAIPLRIFADRCLNI
jgi:DNA polymerase (family 10)